MTTANCLRCAQYCAAQCCARHHGCAHGSPGAPFGACFVGQIVWPFVWPPDALIGALPAGLTDASIDGRFACWSGVQSGDCSGGCSGEPVPARGETPALPVARRSLLSECEQHRVPGCVPGCALASPEHCGSAAPHAGDALESSRAAAHADAPVEPAGVIVPVGAAGLALFDVTVLSGGIEPALAGVAVLVTELGAVQRVLSCAA